MQSIVATVLFTMAAFVLWNKDEEVDADERVPLSQVRELPDIWENAKDEQDKTEEMGCTKE